MKTFITASAALLATTTLATAGGFDRSGQSVGIIFEQGNVAELSFGYVDPELTGTFGGPSSSGDIAPSYAQIGVGIKSEVNENLSIALIMDSPFGADVDYSNSTFYPPALATASASVDSSGITALARYKFNDRVSVHGGLRFVSVEGRVDNIGGGYDATYESDSDIAFVLGAAYEIPDIALRVAVTYSSETQHTLDISAGGSTDVTLPQSVNLDFQTGIAADTLLFANIRWAEWTKTALFDPNIATTLVSHSNDSMSYSLGVGRRFSDSLSGAVTLGYEASQGGLAADLSPTDGNTSIGLGLTYTMDSVKITGGVRYVMVGDATTVNGATFTDNSATAIGLKVSYSF